MFAGHTHQPTDRVVAGMRAVNLGSVSNRITDDLRASYVVLHADRHGHAVEHRRVGYDHEAFLISVRESGHPGSDYIATFQRGEQVRFSATRPGAPDVSPQRRPLPGRKTSPDRLSDRDRPQARGLLTECCPECAEGSSLYGRPKPRPSQDALGVSSRSRNGLLYPIGSPSSR